MTQRKDYGSGDITLREAFVEDSRLFPRSSPEDNFVLWQGTKIRTSMRLPVPVTGRVRASIVVSKGVVSNGFDLKADAGLLRSKEGRVFAAVRTWALPEYEDIVEYSYETQTGFLWFWNVYKIQRGLDLVEEKWTENAGMWVREIGELGWEFHCSPGTEAKPDFETLVVTVEVLPALQ
jgi:hypothetical protein